MNQKTKKKPAIVIGAGVGGMATAIRLAAKGFQVMVFEKNTYPGGKLAQLEMDGFRFDAGPSLFTMPALVEELFELAGKNPQEYFSYERLDVVCKYFYEDGCVINAFANKKDYMEELKSKLGIEAEPIEKHFTKSKEIYDITAKIFLEQSLHKPSTYLNKKTFKAALKLPRINAHLTMNAYNERVLKNEKLVQLFNRYATYIGSDPYQAPATLNIIPHLEQAIGAFFPKGGMHSITLALYKLAKELGVEFVFNSEVKNILIKEKKVAGISLENGQEHFSNLVVSNMDVFHTYKKLLPNEQHPESILNQEKSSSALIFYWGIKRSFPELALHNIFFSKKYKEEFEAIFKKQSIFDDPTIYINISSKHNIADAPPECENWFVMINVPNNVGQDWDKFIKESKKNILKKLSRNLNCTIEPLIVCEDFLDPRRIEQRTSSHLGSLYGNSSNSKLAAFFRHANFSNKIKGLYFCGGSVHPGGGIPLCLYSAKILANLVE